MKSFFVFGSALLLAVFARGAQASSPLKLSCWDNTFSYNKFSVEERSNGFEVSFVGSTLGNFQLFDVSSEVIDFDGWNGQKSLHAVFKLDQCTNNEDVLECNSSHSDPSDYRRLLFVQRLVPDLNAYLQLLIPVEIAKISLKVLQNKSAKLSMISDNGGGSEKVASVSGKTCNSGTSMIEFPQRLRSYLEIPKQ